jgi:hypothetical protein
VSVTPLYDIVNGLSSASWTFVDAPTMPQVTITSTSQRITVSASMSLGVTTGTSADTVDACAQLVSGGPIINFAGAGPAYYYINHPYTPVSVNATRNQFAPGTYYVAPCVAVTNNVPLTDANDSMTGWIMVSN